MEEPLARRTLGTDDQAPCYELNVVFHLLPPNLYVEALTSNVMAFGCMAFGRYSDLD